MSTFGFSNQILMLCLADAELKKKTPNTERAHCFVDFNLSIFGADISHDDFVLFVLWIVTASLVIVTASK